MGAFVEIKKSHLGTGTMARHLAYLGNAEVGRDVNIGAGAITANFDGARKNPTGSATGRRSARAPCSSLR